MRQNVTMLGIYNHDLQGPSQSLVNEDIYDIDAQEKILVVRYLNQGTLIATTMLDAIQLMINCIFKDGSVSLGDTDENFTLVKKRKGNHQY